MSGMADPPQLDTFLATLRRSRLFDATDLDRLAAGLGAESAREFADALIRTQVLTPYQADKLLRGRWQGMVLGPYHILAPLGRGGMGTVVYLARNRPMTEAMGDSVLLALKVLPNRMAEADPKVLARFRREMQLGRRLNHPHVVRSFKDGDLDAVHFLALEYVPGKTVRQIVGERGPMPFGDAARVFADAADGLSHVHEMGLIHRDVKPANLMVRPDGRGVLLDLGLAYEPGERLPEDPAVAGGRGYIVGTLDFLAPEQARDAVTLTPAADLYGLGCSLFYAVTGKLPFPAPTAKEKMRRHRKEPPPPIPGVPLGFARLVQKLMAKRPEDRPATALVARDMLREWASAPSNAPVPVGPAIDPGTIDPKLWDVELDDIPIAEPIHDEVLELPEADELSDASAPRAPAAIPTSLLLAVLAVMLTGLAILAGALRR